MGKNIRQHERDQRRREPDRMATLKEAQGAAQRVVRDHRRALASLSDR